MAKAARLEMTVNLKPLQRLARKPPAMFQKALEKGAIQFLTWANTGSSGSKESRKPPIRWGVLRGSSSAFVGNKLVKIYELTINSESPERPDPAKTHSAKPLTATFVWNTDYANKMHEWQGGWGRFTVQDSDAGNKWVEKHLQADKDLLMEVIGRAYKRESGI
jgi:hypothetical protein